MGAIADRRDGFQYRRKTGFPVVPTYARAPRRVIDIDRDYAGLPPQMRFIEPNAGGTRDAFQYQRRFLHMLAGTGGTADKTLLHIRVIEQAKFSELGGQCFSRTFRKCISVTIVVAKAVTDDRLSDGLATDAAHLALFAANLDAEIGLGRYRQTAVVAGLVSGHSECRGICPATTSVPCGWHRRGGSPRR
jgi:hypothetical protein